MKDGWQPIETAPKEWLGCGKPHRILVWAPEIKCIVIAFWQYGCWLDSEDSDDYDTKATHWHPLPPPPEGVEE